MNRIDVDLFSESNIRQHAANYDSIDAGKLNAWLDPYIPKEHACILDVGAGSGRDATWFASKGHSVCAVEPDPQIHQAAKAKLHDSKPPFTLVEDRLPDLKKTGVVSGMSFDLILLNAVWMFIPETQRERSFRKLITLLKPRGSIAFTLRTPCESHRGMHPTSVSEIEALAQGHGAYVEFTQEVEDLLGRPGVKWHHIIVRLPDDGTGALPLVRRIVLLDNKSATYKLALLRSLCRVASISPGLARESGPDQVAIPLGAVALSWIQLYLPLLNNDMPQRPDNESGGQRIAFVKDALEKFIPNPQDITQLRTGASLHSDRGMDLTKSIRDAAATIAKMPVNYLNYLDGRPIFRVTRKRLTVRRSITLNEEYFSQFGEMTVPIHLWQALLRYNVWIEPALVEEWIRLIRRYAERQNRQVDELKLRRLMRPYEPDRNQLEVRRRALALLETQSIHCVWTGKKLQAGNMDIDHCLPWAVWPCDDLWNLMPSSKTVNRSKRYYLPNNITIREAQDRIMTWWENAYRRETATRERFLLEAKARLPALKESIPSLDDVFLALDLQRTRLYNDHRIPEWSGPRGSNPDLHSTNESSHDL